MGDSITAMTAQKTSLLVGRQKELERLRKAIYRKDDALVVIFLRGRGGMGKTRLMEELLWRTGNFDARQKRPLSPSNTPSDINWHSKNVAVSNLIDMMDARLHARSTLLRKIRDGLRWPHSAGGVDFPRYDQAFDTFRRLSARGAEFRQIREASATAVHAFLEDLAEITKTKRLVWVLDTVEQLSYVSSEWLIRRSLLKPEDMQTRSYQWLLDLIRASQIKNVTLVLSGRDEEGKPFFEDVEKVVNEARSEKRPIRLIEIKITAFNEEDTHQYFQQLWQDWQQKGQAVEWITKQFARLADQTADDYRVLHLYTSGIPVRLALYAQLVVESKHRPERLKLSYTAAQQYARPKEVLELSQWEIEDEFINLLFSKPNNLRLQILKALVRAPRGLTAEQLHYILDSRKQSPQEWEANPHRLREIEREMLQMSDFYLVKVRDMQPLRLGLQDEIYRIYTEHMAPHTEPQSTAVASLWHKLSEKDHARYQQNCEDESEERLELYEKLTTWAAFQYQRCLAQKQEYLRRDESELELHLIPHERNTFQFKELSSEESERRAQLQENLRDAEIEEMIYALLLDPEVNFNHFYGDLTDKKQIADDEITDFLMQTEMWRIIFDPYALKFTPWRDRPSVRERGETPLIVLRRAAQQENVARWIKRFVILGHYDRAMDFAQQVDWAIERVQYEAPISESEWLSWRHTLVHGERRCWRAFAMIYAGQDVPNALAELQEEIEKLSKLVECATDEVAVIHRDGFEERGFAGSIERGIPPHPAEMRVRRIVSHAYNVLGYGFITLGQVREAVAAYGLSLYYLRGAKADSHRATVLNNLSRALSDLGRRSERMCLDGLELRRKIGAEVPLAYSYNTLSLIYDDQDRPEDAWVQSAKAVAYFRRAGNARGLGLSLLQLGEALRHIAAQVRRGQTFVSTPDSLYTTSHELLKESREIFSHLSEPLRLMEINIELGCLYRDWFHAENPDGPDPASVQTGKYREALSYFETGMELAKEKEVAFLVVDALMNTAWAHYYLNRFDEVQEVLTAVVQTIEQEIETKLEERCIIRSDYLPDGTELNNMWVFNQLSKLQSLNGRIAMTRFRHRAIQVKQDLLEKGQMERRERHQATRQDVTAQGYLAQAAYAYIFAIEYAILFSPHAATITLIEDNLYNYLKRFNQTELEDFHTHVQAWSSRFPALKDKVQGHRLLEDFLHEFFGLPWHDYE